MEIIQHSSVKETSLSKSINPQKVEMYLEYKGWRKERELENIASVWTNIFKGSKISLILPIDREFIDFGIKIEELFKVLEKVEQRPKNEILKVLESTSKIASEKKREIIDLKIQFEEKNKHEVSAKEAGGVLKSMQDFFGAVGKLKAKTVKKRNEKNNIKSELQLSLLDTFQGSFGLRMGLGNALNTVEKSQFKQLSIFDNLAAEEAAEDFMSLIEASAKNAEALRIIIEKFQGEPSIKFKSLIRHLINLESDLVLEWGSVNPNKGKFTKLDYTKLIQALDVISKFEIENPYTFEVIGRLIVGGVGKKKEKRIFVISDEINNIEYKGYISENLIRSLNNNIELDRVYKSLIEQKTEFNTLTGEEYTTYTLVDLENI